MPTKKYSFAALSTFLFGRLTARGRYQDESERQFIISVDALRHRPAKIEIQSAR